MVLHSVRVAIASISILTCIGTPTYSHASYVHITYIYLRLLQGPNSEPNREAQTITLKPTRDLYMDVALDLGI
jgi:hypothetical protein